MREYVVSLHAGINYDQVWADIENPTLGLPHIPDRPVSIVNNRDAMDRLCHYALTDAEADALRRDPRVIAVEIPIKDRPEISFRLKQKQTGNFNKLQASVNQGNNVNWGLIRHTSQTNIYGSSANTSITSYNYTLDGSGVDVVITDSGIQADHPEFTDANGNSRIKLWNWENNVPSTLQAKIGRAHV